MSILWTAAVLFAAGVLCLLTANRQDERRHGPDPKRNRENTALVIGWFVFSLICVMAGRFAAAVMAKGG